MSYKILISLLFYPFLISCGGSSGSSSSSSSKASSSQVLAITLGGEYGAGSHNCTIMGDKTVQCWGNNESGQIGGGVQNEDRTLILSGTEGRPLSSREKATAITAGESHTCAILTDKSVKCWGNNAAGEVGGGNGGMIATAGTEGRPSKQWRKSHCHYSGGKSHLCHFG